MSVLYIVLPLAILVAAGFVAAFIWATKRGQFDDMETPALRILMDERRRAEDEAGSEEDAGVRGTHD